MARDGLTTLAPGHADERRPDERPAPAFGPLQGGSIIHWKVQERRS